MQISLIPADSVLDVWPKLAAYAAKVAAYTHGRYEAEDILDTIQQYGDNLWIAFEGDVFFGMVVTRFVQYPRIRCLDVVFCAGEDVADWKDPMFKILQHWAYDNHCDRIESSGRLGWSKLFKDAGYKPLWQVFELPVADSGLGE
jgi:esterase/lipase superfamily enzyme